MFKQMRYPPLFLSALLPKLHQSQPQPPEPRFPSTNQPTSSTTSTPTPTPPKNKPKPPSAPSKPPPWSNRSPSPASTNSLPTSRAEASAWVCVRGISSKFFQSPLSPNTTCCLYLFIYFSAPRGFALFSQLAMANAEKSTMTSAVPSCICCRSSSPARRSRLS